MRAGGLFGAMLEYSFKLLLWTAIEQNRLVIDLILNRKVIIIHILNLTYDKDMRSPLKKEIQFEKLDNLNIFFQIYFIPIIVDFTVK